MVLATHIDLFPSISNDSPEPKLLLNQQRRLKPNKLFEVCDMATVPVLSEPDGFLTAEFGEGELSKRLWRGGMRASEHGYTLVGTVSKLTNALRNGLDLRFADDGGVITCIINDIETAWNDLGRLRRACYPLCQYNDKSGDESGQVQNESDGTKFTSAGSSFASHQFCGGPTSLAKHFLSIDVFQCAIADCIVNKMSEVCTSDLNNNVNKGECEIGPMLLNQLRWLNFLVDGDKLCESLLSILTVVPLSFQKEIIEAIPEILDDSSKPKAVSELIRLLDETPALMGSVVDALASLGVDDERLPDVNGSILMTLGAANRDVLPVTIRYLLRTCPASLVTPTVDALRNTLALSSLGAASGKLCLDAVTQGLRTSKLAAQHILKMMRNINDPTLVKPADLWLIIALYGSPVNRKPAEVAFKRKAAIGAFTRPLMEAALQPFAIAFSDITSVLIALASTAVKAMDIGTRRAGVTLYALLFKLFDSGTTRRNVVVGLIEHASSRKSVEQDTALTALVVIARDAVHDRSILPHSAAIQNLLDSLETFTDAQLRQLWSVMGYLCCASASKDESKTRRKKIKTKTKRKSRSSEDADVVDDIEGNDDALDDEDDGSDEVDNIDMDGDGGQGDIEGTGEGELQMLEILLRKELTHPDIFYRRIGVIGACTMIKVLGNQVENNILTLLLDIGHAHPFSQAVAFDELAELFSDDDMISGADFSSANIGSGSGSSSRKASPEYIRRKISKLFEDNYLPKHNIMKSYAMKNEKHLKAVVYGNLDDIEIDVDNAKDNADDESSDVIFSIAHIVRNELTLGEAQDAIRSMVPNLRLLCVLTSLKYNGSLAEVDAMIGAPLYIPVYPIDRDIDDITLVGRTDLLLNLFIAHGWLVELVNAFARQQNSELRAKCVMRVDNIMDIIAQIARLIPDVPHWRDVVFDQYNGTRPDLLRSGPGGTSGPGRKKKDKGTTAGENGAPAATSTATTVGMFLQDGGGSAGVMEWKRFSRQLNPAALSLIHVQNPITWRYTDTHTADDRDGEPDVREVTLTMPALHYLLCELSEHVRDVVGGAFRNANALAVSMFHGGAVASAAKRGGKRSVGAGSSGGVDAGLKRLSALRSALEALGPQLARCLDKMFSGENDIASQREDDVTMSLYRDCVVLCLQSLSLSLNSAVINDEMAQEILFYILASIRLDNQPLVAPSDPMTKQDIETAARVAFEQLHDRIRTILAIKTTKTEEPSGSGSGGISRRGNSTNANENGAPGTAARERGRGNSASNPEAAVDIDETESRADELQLDGCCAIIAAMDSVFQLCSERQQGRLGPKLSHVAQAIMQHAWPDTVLGAKKTLKLIPGLVRIFVQLSTDPLKEADGLRLKITRLTERQGEIERRRAVNTQDLGATGLTQRAGGLGSLTERTVYVYSIAVLDQYICLFKEFKPAAFERSEDAFTRMDQFIAAEQPLYMLARQNQRLLGPIMRAGRTFVELFLHSCMPFLNDRFKDFSNNVVQTCRNHQKPTRLLQSFCAHSKSVRDTTLTGLVPPLRKCLELLVYQVKSLLRGHNSGQAFQLGNLKHRDINGMVINSQQMAPEEEEQKDDEEEEVEDDEGEDDNESVVPPLQEDGNMDGSEERVVVMTDEDEDEGEVEDEPRRKRKIERHDNGLGSTRKKSRLDRKRELLHQQQDRQTTKKQKKKSDIGARKRDDISRALQFGRDNQSEDDSAEKGSDGGSGRASADEDEEIADELFADDITNDADDGDEDDVVGDDDDDDMPIRRGSLNDRRRSMEVDADADEDMPIAPQHRSRARNNDHRRIGHTKRGNGRDENSRRLPESMQEMSMPLGRRAVPRGDRGENKRRKARRNTSIAKKSARTVPMARKQPVARRSIDLRRVRDHNVTQRPRCALIDDEAGDDGDEDDLDAIVGEPLESQFIIGDDEEEE